MSRFLAVALIFLALFVGAPRKVCACNDAGSQAVSTHSCCSAKSKAACHTSDSQSITMSRSCCGMEAHYTPSLASSIHLLPECEYSAAVQISIRDVSYFLSMFENEVLGHPNRAPPRLVGMGTSKTYLFKRTFLI